jgi:transposase
MEHGKTSTKIAGVDISKRHLDVAMYGSEDEARFGNTPEGHAALASWLARRGGACVGMEATGGYEKGVCRFLQEAGFETVLHQPLEVRLFARLRRQRARSDRLDARLIAAATARVEAVKAAADPYVAELAERMTAYEQAADLLAQARTCREHTRLADLREGLEDHIRILAARKKALAADLLRRIRAREDLGRRFDLLVSLSGIGKIVAATLVIRMPELGAMDHGQPSALPGVAPFDRDSGEWKGQRFIGGGPQRPRRLVYIAALAARRSDPDLKAFADRLAARRKPPKLVLVAVMRKLIEAANLVLKRGTPWSEKKPKTA